MSRVGCKLVSMGTVVRIVAERQYEGREEVQIAYVCPYASGPLSAWYPVRWLDLTGWEMDATAECSVQSPANAGGEAHGNR